jgi:transposase
MKKQTEKPKVKKAKEKTTKKVNKSRRSNAGRKTKYNAEVMIPIVSWMARGGATMEEIAKQLKVHISRLYAYKERYPEFKEAIEGGKNFFDAGVEKGLLKRATGYDLEEVEVEYEIEFVKVYKPYTSEEEAKIKNGEFVERKLLREDKIEREIKRKVKTKHIPPDTKAALEWLYNRQRDTWKKSVDINLGGQVDVNGKNREITEELLRIPGVAEAIRNNFRSGSTGSISEE